jgi:hypothetical protein
MINKQELAIAASFVVANSALAALVCDWFFFTKQITMDATDTVSCSVYPREAYNVYGAICGVGVSDIVPVFSTLQILLPINFAFSLLLFFLISFRRLKQLMIKITSLIIVGLCVASLILWMVSDTERLNDESINHYGSGFILTIVCAASNIPLIMI